MTPKTTLKLETVLRVFFAHAIVCDHGSSTRTRLLRWFLRVSVA